MRSLEVLLLVAAVAPVHAAEYAVFASGFRQLVDGHDLVGDKIRLHANGGYTEVDAVQVAGFETVEAVPKPIPAQAPAPPKILASEPLPDLRAEVDAAADRYELPRQFVHGVVQAESAYRADAISSAGAIGPMQLMPETAAMYGADPHNPKQNIDAGTRYLRDLLWMYRHDDRQLSKTLAAYNAGPGAVARYNGVPPYRETRNYVRKILGKYLKTNKT
jgi:soluble lytic murein transglycosylase-like protein